MKAKTLLNEIKKDLEDYPIEYLKKKATDTRYPDNIYKQLANYNSETYEEIFTKEINDFNINDTLVENMSSDLDFYLKENGVSPEENKFTKSLSLYLALISKKPLRVL